MSYNDEYHSDGSLFAYDGEMLPALDALKRYERDRRIQEKYAEAVENVDASQMTWDDVGSELTGDE